MQEPDVASAALASVGQLLVPTQRFQKGYARHYDEHCSATLVAEALDTPDPTPTSSRLIVSAWHCIEHYRDLSRPLIFETQTGLRRSAVVLGSGGGMHSDWALLRLNQPLPNPALLSLRTNGIAPRALTLAGFPKNPQGTRRTLQVRRNCVRVVKDPKRNIAAVHSDIGRAYDGAVGSDEAVGADEQVSCVIRKGASGGGVFHSLAPNRYAGVISRGDSQSRSIYVPVERFLKHLRPFF